MLLARVQPRTQLLPIDLVTPGNRGLNTVQSGALIGQEYATAALNAVIDTSGRLSARQGLVTQTTTPVAGNPKIQTIFEYIVGDGTYQQIVAWNGGAANAITNPNVASIVGTASLANGRWWLRNFNNKLIGFQTGQKPAVYTKAGGVLNTVVESSGTWSVGNGVGCVAFGRVWAVAKSDSQTIEYSGLLDETDRGSPSSGVIDMHTIWSDGTDQITAIFAFNAALVVCGLRHIIMFTDGRGSMLGLDPTQAYVFDIITGTGCINQWTVDYIGESDVVFLSPNGVQSLSRLTQDRSNPAGTLTKFVRDALLNNYTGETSVNVSGSYNPLEGKYVLAFPTSKVIWCLDMRRRYTDDVNNLCCPVTTWNMEADAVAQMHATPASNLTSMYIARTPGTIAQYTGNSDEGVQYQFQYTSPWMSFSQQEGEQVSVKLKMLKRYEAILFTGGNATINFLWTVDFGAATNSASFTLAGTGVSSQYGLGQYGIAQYGGGQNLSILKYDARARGQYYQIGITTTVSSAFSIQQIQLATKIGRVA